MSFLCDVPERRRRVRLAQWRTGSRWMAEETGRWQRLDRTQRPCPHCQAPLEDVRHAVYDCPLHAGLWEEYAELFRSPGRALPSLAAFLGQGGQGVAGTVEELSILLPQPSQGFGTGLPGTHTSGGYCTWRVGQIK